MWKLFGRTKEFAAGACDCGAVCERRCEVDALARETFDQLLHQGWRSA